MNATISTTSSTTSEARQLAERYLAHDPSGALPTLGILPAPSSVNHQDYSVGYFDDKSILIWAKGEGYVVLDQPVTYYRDRVEHLARCLGLFTQARRAEMIGGQDKWIDGIHWAADGSWIGF